MVFAMYMTRQQTATTLLGVSATIKDTLAKFKGFGAAGYMQKTTPMKSLRIITGGVRLGQLRCGMLLPRPGK